MPNETKARKFADTNCEFCEGTGMVQEPDGEERYCLCATTNMAELQAESNEE